MKITKRQLKRIIREETVGVDDPSKTADAFAGGEVGDEMFVDVDDEVLLNINEKRPGAAGQVADLEKIPEGKRRSSIARIRRIVKEERARLLREFNAAARSRAQSVTRGTGPEIKTANEWVEHLGQIIDQDMTSRGHTSYKEEGAEIVKALEALRREITDEMRGSTR